MGFNLGALAGGVAEGLDRGQRLRLRRQAEKMGDIEYRRARDSERARQMNMDENGFPVSHEGMEDPYAFRLRDMVAKMFGRGRRSALPAGTIDESGAYGGFDEGMFSNYDDAAAGYQPEDTGFSEDAVPLREGGEAGEAAKAWNELSDDEKAVELARRNRARTAIPDPATPTSETVDWSSRPSAPRRALGAAKDAIDASARAPEGAGLLRRGANAVGRVAAPIALGETALKTWDTPTEDYRKRFGLETDDPSLAGDLAVRTLGAASDLGSVLTLGAADRFYADKQEKRSALPSQAPATPPLEEVAVTSSRRGGAAPAAAAPARRAAVPQNPAAAAAAEPEKIDWSKVDWRTVPDFKAEDWTKYRTQSFRTLVMNGAAPIEAAQKVDQAVTEMQQRNFVNLAQQGMARQEMGDLNGAMAAYRAAFQYFPSGSDVKFGVYNGHIVGTGVDEKTGKPTGQPMLIDAERVAALIDNFKKPEAWQHWAKDRRDFAMQLKKYIETEKPAAEAQASAQLTNAKANLMNAASNADYRSARAGALGAGGGGMKPADFDRAGDDFVTAAENFAYDSGAENPQQLARTLASAMAQYYRTHPDVDPRRIVEIVINAAQQSP